jgi:hypothetical protein
LSLIETKGVVVLKNIFSKKDLDEFDKNWHEVQKKLGQLHMIHSKYKILESVM